MREPARLEAGRAEPLRDRLDQRLAERRLRARHARALARALAEWHARSEPSGVAESCAAPAELARRTQRAALALARDARFPARERDALLDLQRRFLAHGADALLDRIVARRVRPLHGALGLRKAWLAKGRRVTLGPERAGAAGDVAEDVAALTLGLRARGAERRAEQLAAAYALAADDYGIYAVLDFYERAAALARAAEGDGADAPDGAAAARTLLGRTQSALVIAVGGTVASGKSTVARAVARRLAAPRVVADRVRDALLAPGRASTLHEGLWARSFAPEFAERVYEGMLLRAERVLASGRAVVLDACFPDARRRRAAAALAERHGVQFSFVHCDPPAAAIEARLCERDARDAAAAGGWHALAGELAAHWEPPGPGWLRVDTSSPRAEWKAEIETACSRWRAIARAVEA